MDDPEGRCLVVASLGLSSEELAVIRERVRPYGPRRNEQDKDVLRHLWHNIEKKTEFGRLGS